MAIITDTTGARIAQAIENLDLDTVSSTDILDVLDSTAINKALSANQGRVLDGKVTTANTNIATVSNKVPFSFGVNGDGKYGYIKDGESTVIPFETSQEEQSEEPDTPSGSPSYYTPTVEFKPVSQIGDYHATSGVDRWLGSMCTNSGVWGHQGLTGYRDTTIRTKNYIICYDSNHTHESGESSDRFNRIIAFDKDGNRYDVQARHYTGIQYANYRQCAMKLCAFDASTYEEYPQYADYWYAYSGGHRYIEVFDGIKSIGRIDVYSLGWTTDFLNGHEYYEFMDSPLIGKPEILIYRNISQTAYILGVDIDGNLNPFNVLTVSLTFPNSSTGASTVVRLMCGRVYGTRYGWCGLNENNAAKNTIFSISDTGVGAAYTLTLLHATNTYDGPLGGIVEDDENHVTIAVNSYYSGQTFYDTNFIRINSQSLTNTELIHTAYRWAHPSYTYQPYSYEAFFETDDYIYFIPSVGYAMYYSSLTGITHVTSTLYTLPLNVSSNPTQTGVINTFCRIKKSNLSVSYHVYPWAQTGQTEQCITWLRTKDDYVWVMPPKNLAAGKFMVVTPADEIKTVDIGTTAYYWSGAQPFSWWSGNSRMPAAIYATRSAVNNDGIGCIVDRQGSAILTFWGDCHYRLQTYNTPGTNGFGVVPRLCQNGISRDTYLGNTDYNLGNAVGTVGHSFILASYYSDYMTYVVITPTDDPENEDVLINRCPPYYPGTSACRWTYPPDAWDRYEFWHDYRKHGLVVSTVLPLAFNQGCRWGYFVEHIIPKPVNID